MRTLVTIRSFKSSLKPPCAACGCLLVWRHKCSPLPAYSLPRMTLANIHRGLYFSPTWGGSRTIDEIMIRCNTGRRPANRRRWTNERMKDMPRRTDPITMHLVDGGGQTAVQASVSPYATIQGSSCSHVVTTMMETTLGLHVCFTMVDI